ncbi:acetylcholinesterase isoform X1 [Tetranychus urticae]|uniref:Carboxylic ester hydrolase n=1 Tax=Tetranychus urticae TaxID=32264 RepID=T1KX09_TETUR|nr:acetylcholinesterase isoform X1 [Tetranychus urticae]
MDRRRVYKTNVSPRPEVELVKKSSARRALIITIVVVILFVLSLVFVKLLLPLHLRLPDFVELNIFTDSSSSESLDQSSPTDEHSNEDSSLIVTTSYGALRGFKVSVLQRSIGVFLGIPYAAPPIGANRFRKPQPLQSWNNIRDATRFGPQCVQFKPNRTYTPWISPEDYMSEDCLYLNIWVPLEESGFRMTQSIGKQKRASMQLPVMLWIHGGAFFSGSADLSTYDGRILSSFGNVIVVTINYRLGAFGFLNLGTASAPGNQGLHDQVAALKWVQDNIAHFGGDPNQVTLFGQSAGAISVGLHYISPLSSDLFRRGIMQSGAPTVTRLFYEREGAYGRRGLTLASMVGCLPDDAGANTTNTTSPIFSSSSTPSKEQHHHQSFPKTPEVIADCLRSVDLKQLTEAQNNLIDEMSLSFGPSLGDDFLPANPISLMDLGEIGDQREVMLGSTQDEGTFFLHYLDPKLFGATLNNVSHSRIMQFVRQSFPFLTPRVASLVYSSFLPISEDTSPADVRQILSDFIGDSTFTCPLTLFSQLFVKNEGSAYFYVFDHKPSNSPWPNWMGVLHFDEVQFIFGVPLRQPHLYQSEEVEFSKRLMKTWVSFAKNGVPGNQMDVDWPEYTPETPHYVDLKPVNATIESGPKESVCARWHIMLQTS